MTRIPAAWKTVFGALAGEAGDHFSLYACRALISLAGTGQDLERVRTALLARLDSATEPRDIALLAEQLSPLVHEEHDRERLRTTLLGKLAGTDDFGRVAGVIGELSATESGKAEARRALLAELHENGVGNLTEWALTAKIIDLRPDVADLDVLGDPPYGLSDEVLAAMRENSPLDAWLAALPKLSPPRQSASTKGPGPRAPHRNPSAN